MTGKLIEILILLAGLLIAAAFVIYIPLTSYIEYKDYLAQIEQQKLENEQAAIKPKLESLTVELKEGVRYFANDMADPKPEHFTVVANYVKGEEQYSEPVEEGKFTVKTSADFYSKGGEIVVSFKGASVTLAVELEPVLLESLSVAVNPYTIKYQQGTSFDDAGMVIHAHYNDGSSKVLSSDEYSVDTEKTLTTADKSVAVSYTAGEVTKAVDVNISVVQTLNNGAVTSIVIVNNAIVNAGDNLANASMEVNAVYESGNRKLLSPSEYTISASIEPVQFGKTYQLTVSYNQDRSKTAKTDVIVRQTIQGEDGTIVGGEVLTEPEYVVVDGVITETDNQVKFAGKFSKAVLNGQEASLTLTLMSSAKTIGDITMRCSNSYNVYANGTNANEGYMMKPLQINTILDLTVNGREVKVPATVVLKGCGPHEKYAPLYGIYYEFTFEDIELDAGINQIEFHFKKSTVGATNCWGESPSTLNIDYVNFDTLGSEIPETYTITGIEISDLFAPQYPQSFDEVEIPVIATIDNGTKIGLDSSLYDVTIIGDSDEDYFLFGDYTITVTLKSDPTIKATKVVTVEGYEKFVVLNAGIEIIDGRVYYVFSGESVGYTADDLVFFDGSTKYDFICEFTKTTFTLKIDVTDLSDRTIYPHIEIDGSKYENGANANGDIRGNGLTYTNGQSVTLDGKKYTINTEWSMPTLVITQELTPNPDPNPNPNPTTSYDANLDVNFESDKTYIGKLVFGSEGVVTNGTDQNKEFTGGIGGIDQLNRYVQYTITPSQSGYVDIVWYIAANWWKNNTNNDISNIGLSIKLTIDGSPVDLDGIALVKGSDSTLWWNIKPIVITNVPVTAGVPVVIYAECITAGKGINVGSFEYYYSATESDYSKPETAYDYDANVDASFVSNKPLLGKYVYGSEGVSTNGSDKNSEYPGGIGGMDKLNKYVTYTFTVSEDGTADIIWYIAGSRWNGSGNDGLKNAGEHLVVTIDGKEVDFNGIELLPGADSAWWNVQPVVIKGVKLSAGEHVISCTITTDGAGLNVGAMNIYFE